MVSCGAMDLTPILYIVREQERPLLCLIQGLLATITATSVILVISLVCCVDFLVVLLLL
jgi:hypothetical protein